MVPAPTLTKIVVRMVSANLVYRRVDDADRRRVLVFAADRGREALSRWNVAADAAMSNIEAAVGGEEIVLLRALLLSRASTRLTSPPAVSGD
jgi:DNA-binding MarR family transcriptional regulator